MTIRNVSLVTANCIYLSELTDFLTLLDTRYKEKVRKEGTFMARKVRHSGTPSTREPPVDAPDWTIDHEWSKSQSGKFH